MDGILLVFGGSNEDGYINFDPLMIDLGINYNLKIL